MSRADSSYNFLSASIEDNASNLINITFSGDISLNTTSVSDYTVLVNKCLSFFNLKGYII